MCQVSLIKCRSRADASEGSRHTLLLPLGEGTPGLDQPPGFRRKRRGKAKQGSGTLQPMPRGCREEQGVMEGQTAQGSEGLVLRLLQLCELLSAGSGSGRKDQPARTWCVGQLFTITPFISTHHSLFLLCLTGRFKLSSFQKKRKYRNIQSNKASPFLL